MKIESNHALSVDDILLTYSGRRLHYAIRMGILPTPVNFCELVKRQQKTIARKRKTAKRGNL
jgi:hypothetical protein